MKKINEERTYPLSIENMNEYRKLYYPHGSGPLSVMSMVIFLLDELAKARGYAKRGDGYNTEYVDCLKG